LGKNKKSTYVAEKCTINIIIVVIYYYGIYCFSPSIPHTKWSQCSKQYLADSFQKGVGACLKNIPDITTDRNTSVCGNGIVEADEQCDCGNLDKKVSDQMLKVLTITIRMIKL